MAKSIIQKDKECLKCGTTINLHKHHLYFNANRKISERLGLWCYLCYYHHNGSTDGVHFDRKFDLELKRLGQEIYEQNHTRDEFMQKIGRSYL